MSAQAAIVAAAAALTTIPRATAKVTGGSRASIPSSEASASAQPRAGPAARRASGAVGQLCQSVGVNGAIPVEAPPAVAAAWPARPARPARLARRAAVLIAALAAAVTVNRGTLLRASRTLRAIWPGLSSYATASWPGPCRSVSSPRSAIPVRTCRRLVSDRASFQVSRCQPTPGLSHAHGRGHAHRWRVGRVSRGSRDAGRPHLVRVPDRRSARRQRGRRPGRRDDRRQSDRPSEQPHAHERRAGGGMLGGCVVLRAARHTQRRGHGGRPGDARQPDSSQPRPARAGARGAGPVRWRLPTRRRVVVVRPAVRRRGGGGALRDGLVAAGSLRQCVSARISRLGDFLSHRTRRLKTCGPIPGSC